ncbi:hypothetical protein MYX64_08710 [Nitrospinae bacterium AH_259_B05_G02_I21]|nr:hypothetical protein [Nitrospinae bacterium AH_259_B05_G02_I21]
MESRLIADGCRRRLPEGLHRLAYNALGWAEEKPRDGCGRVGGARGRGEDAGELLLEVGHRIRASQPLVGEALSASQITFLEAIHAHGLFFFLDQHDPQRPGQIGLASGEESPVGDGRRNQGLRLQVRGPQRLKERVDDLPVDGAHKHGHRRPWSVFHNHMVVVDRLGLHGQVLFQLEGKGLLEVFFFHRRKREGLEKTPLAGQTGDNQLRADSLPIEGRPHRFGHPEKPFVGGLAVPGVLVKQREATAVVPETRVPHPVGPYVEPQGYVSSASERSEHGAAYLPR